MYVGELFAKSQYVFLAFQKGLGLVCLSHFLCIIGIGLNVLKNMDYLHGISSTPSFELYLLYLISMDNDPTFMSAPGGMLL